MERLSNSPEVTELVMVELGCEPEQSGMLKCYPPCSPQSRHFCRLNLTVSATEWYVMVWKEKSI